MRKHILIIRFSAMGDVAMTVPVVVSLLEQNPEVEVTIVTKKLFKSFFPKSDRIHFHEADLYGRHKGFVGLFKLFRELSNTRYTSIADLHNVLRSHILTLFFKVYGSKVYSIKKGRKQKKSIVNKIVKKQLKTTHQRYADVFSELGIGVQLDGKLKDFLFYGENVKLPKHIGIAPFAMYDEKRYSLERMTKVINNLSQKGYKIYLFGGGDFEIKELEKLIFNKNIINYAKENIDSQLVKMSELQVMVSMDSSNMHMASLVGTKVISIWGATHTNTGFLGYGQSLSDVVGREDLDCRPCSVFGNKKCFKQNIECLDIDHKIIENKIIENTILAD